MKTDKMIQIQKADTAKHAKQNWWVFSVAG